MTNDEPGQPAAPALRGHPASGWVRFLRSYGPTPSNTTLFDEYTVDALRRANVSPIRLTSPVLPEILARADSDVPGSILIAGTAGDGKTYHARTPWTHLGGGAADWTDKKPVKEITLPDGRVSANAGKAGTTGLRIPSRLRSARRTSTWSNSRRSSQ